MELADNPGETAEEDANYPIDNVYGYGHVMLYQDVFEAMTTGRRALIEGAEGLRLSSCFTPSMSRRRPVVQSFSPSNEAMGATPTASSAGALGRAAVASGLYRGRCEAAPRTASGAPVCSPRPVP